MRFGSAVAFLILCSAVYAQAGHMWTFAVSGDSRNCGDVVMPAIARGVLADQSLFYWHLGDFRAIYRFDQDYEQIHRHGVMSVTDYLANAWPDLIEHQMRPFGSLPVYLALGNHELIPPKTRSLVIDQFSDWLNQPAVGQRRAADDPHDHEVRTYYHWLHDRIDFITLDNASTEQFDANQLKWLRRVLDRATGDAGTRAVVVGMHEALPDSISADHSMSQSKEGVESGRQVYQWLLEVRTKKPVYVLASHSHFYMQGIFNTDYVKAHGGVLPGWIVGTAGAERYHLPADKTNAVESREHVYGYLTAQVTADKTNPIQFRFKQLEERDVPSAVVNKFSAAFVHECWAGNPAKW